MRKISFVILGLLISATIAQSAIDTSLCAQAPYDVSNKFSQVMSTITGSNFIATKAAELAIQSQLKKDILLVLKMRITLFSLAMLTWWAFLKTMQTTLSLIQNSFLNFTVTNRYRNLRFHRGFTSLTARATFYRQS